MVLAGMNLLDDAADTGTIVANDHEKVFGDESHFLIRRHDLYMGEALLVRADFVLALNDENAPLSQDAVRFFRSVVVQLQDCLVILASRQVARGVVAIVILELIMNRVSASARRVHIGGIEDDAIQRAVLVRERAAIYAVLEIGSLQVILAIRDLSPKHPLAVGDIGDFAAGLYVQPENMGKDGIVAFGIGAEHQLI